MHLRNRREIYVVEIVCGVRHDLVNFCGFVQVSYRDV